MKVKDIADILETYAPLHLQEEYDNCGLNVGNYNTEVTGIVLCLDVTEAVLEEAVSLSANLIVSHHPLLFNPLKQVVDADQNQRIVAKAILAGVSIYCCHTCLDAAPSGMSFRLGEILGLQNMEVFIPNSTQAGAGYGVIGTPDQVFRISNFLDHVKRSLNCKCIRTSALIDRPVKRVALSTGSGSSFIKAAMASGADIYLSADFKYNDFYLPDGKMVIADIGHFESEYCAIDLLYDIITKKIPTFAVHKSKHSTNPVNYC